MPRHVIVSADELCVALEKTLREHLEPTLEQLGWAGGPFRPIREWQQVPTKEAILEAPLPAVGISTPGMVGAPTYRPADQAWRATWRIAVAVYDRGRDYSETQHLARGWMAAIRLATRSHRTLGGVATGTEWRGEEYALVADPKKQSRTLAGGAVAFDVSAFVIDTLGNAPTVASTPTTVSVQQPGGTP